MHAPHPTKLPCVCNERWSERVLRQTQFVAKMNTEIALHRLISINSLSCVFPPTSMQARSFGVSELLNRRTCKKIRWLHKHCICVSPGFCTGPYEYYLGWENFGTAQKEPQDVTGDKDVLTTLLSLLAPEVAKNGWMVFKKANATRTLVGIRISPFNISWFSIRKGIYQPHKLYATLNPRMFLLYLNIHKQAETLWYCVRGNDAV